MRRFIASNVIRIMKRGLRGARLLPVLAVMALCVAALPAGAQTKPHVQGTCTHDENFEVPYTTLEPGSGLISTIVTDIHRVLYNSIYRLYDHILKDEIYQGMLAVGLTIYIAIYGILFTFGMTQNTVYNVFMSVLKIGVIFWLLGGGNADEWWFELFNLQWTFFTLGTDHLIAAISSIAVGGVSAPYDPDVPFALLDKLIATVVSAKMAVTLLAIPFTGGYGVMFGVLMVLAVLSLLKSLLVTIWIYVMSLVLRALLIGLSPIFIAFVLFNRTRPLFDGWLNQLVNTCLQPVFVFMFFAFFASLIEGSMKQLLGTPVCWTEWIDSIRGTSTHIHYWRFAVWSEDTLDWEPYSGLWAWDGNDKRDGVLFPIRILDILVFLTLAELAGRFNQTIVMIAKDIAGAATDISSMQGPMSQWLGGDGRKNSPLASGIGARNIPGAASKSQDRGTTSIRDKNAGMSGARRGPS